MHDVGAALLKADGDVDLEDLLFLLDDQDGDGDFDLMDVWKKIDGDGDGQLSVRELSWVSDKPMSASKPNSVQASPSLPLHTPLIMSPRRVHVQTNMRC